MAPDAAMTEAFARTDGVLFLEKTIVPQRHCSKVRKTRVKVCNYLKRLREILIALVEVTEEGNAPPITDAPRANVHPRDILLEGFWFRISSDPIVIFQMKYGLSTQGCYAGPNLAA